MTWETYLFSSGSHLCSGIMANADSWFITNITFIQLSTWHESFYLAHLIFFCLCVSAVFCLAYLHVNLIPFNWFLTILQQTLIPVSTHLSFIFVVDFLFSRHIAFSFFILMFWFLSWPRSMFPFLTIPFLLYLHKILNTTDWKHPTFFVKLCCRVLSWKSFTFLFIVLVDSSIVGAIFSFN